LNTLKKQKGGGMLVRIMLFICMMPMLFVNISLAEEDPILAKAGDIAFRKSDLDRLLSYSPPYLKKQLEENPDYKVTLITKIMEQKILSDIARKEGFDKKADVKEQLQYLVDDFLTKEYLTKVIIADVTVSDSDLEQYYKSNEKSFHIPEQVKARHILIKVPFGVSKEEKKKAKDRAEQILEWLKKGEKFETLAEQYSEDPKSKAKGGELGYISKGQMPKPFEEAAFSLKIGEISSVVETDYGYHIIQVDDHKEARTRTFEEVKEQIKKQLTDERSRSKAEEFIKKAVKDSGLEIYREKIVVKESK
jgi:peptidyl-prolyl cis-trans isomerase C